MLRTGWNALAQHFGVSRQALSALLNGRASLSADMAIRFEHAFGIRADTLMRMQAAWDMAEARKHESDLVVPDLRKVDPCVGLHPDA